MHKLTEVVRKATIANVVDQTRVSAMLNDLNYRVCNGWLEPGEASIRGLSGRGLPGNRGLLDLILLQHDLAKHLLHETMESLPIHASSKKELRSRMDTVMHYDIHCCCDNLAWLGVLDPTAQRFHTLLTSLCYTRDYDGHL